MKIPTWSLFTLMPVLAMSFGGSGTLLAQTSSSSSNTSSISGTSPKILIAYFSQTGNTRAIADQIQAVVGGDLFQVVTAESYPEDYQRLTEVARKEQADSHRPPLKGRVENMASYDLIFLGYPNWWGSMPMAMFTFLESYDLSGKIIIPFCTHEGSGLGRSEVDLKKLAPKADIRKGLAVRGSGAGTAQKEVKKWLEVIS